MQFTCDTGSYMLAKTIKIYIRMLGRNFNRLIAFLDGSVIIDTVKKRVLNKIAV